MLPSSLTLLPALRHACSLPAHGVPVANIMKHSRLLTFGFLIFTTTNASALPALSLPTNPAPSSPPTTVTVPGWTYRGCYSDHIDDRTLTGKKWTGKLTPRRCAIICSGYRYFALESSNECYCGNTVARASITMPDYFCTSVCSGNEQSVCGGQNVLGLYEANKFASIGSSATLLISSNSTTNSSYTTLSKPPTLLGSPAVVSVPGWKYRGCWSDNPLDRTLIAKRWKGYVTPENCAHICKGFRFFGLEYSNECYCGNTISHESQQVPENVCSRICMGNFQAFCGGSNALTMYEVEPEVTVS